MKHIEYYNIVKKQLEEQMTSEQKNIEEAAKACAEAIMKKRLIHVFGCGHSQMFAMEVFYRAGGLVPVNALLVPHLAIFPHAKLSTFQERIEGFSQEYLELQNTSADDVMIIVSISGRNAAVIDMAIAAKEKGMKVIALMSRQFSDKVSSRHSSGKKLNDFADIIIDIKCVEGDACLSIDGLPVRFSGTSTILGMTVMNSIMARCIEICVNKGYNPPIYVSSNLDEGDDINKKHIENYKGVISCL